MVFSDDQSTFRIQDQDNTVTNIPLDSFSFQSVKYKLSDPDSYPDLTNETLDTTDDTFDSIDSYYDLLHKPI